MIPLLAALIPTIVSVVGDAVRGKSNAVDAALNVVQEVVGHPVDSLDDVNPDELTSDQLLKLKELDLDYQYKVFKAETEDAANARQREVEIIKSGHIDWPKNVYNMVITIGYFIVIFTIFHMYAKDLINKDEGLIIGSVLTGLFEILRSIGQGYNGKNKN